MVGIHVHPQRHGKVLRSTAAPEVLQDLHEKHELIFIRHELQLREFAHELLFCTVATKAESFGKARDKMIDICQRIGLEADDVSMEELLDYFTQHQSAS
nr:hypothetical protein BaRGS_034880 [Batillaria attramentaria]